ncbi:MAG: ATP-binding protein [Desulfuromonadaceae bacterium]|nr:ATP-binding protein [Desulfuromonadaceae bacterium]
MEYRDRLTDIINFLPDATWAIDTEGTVIAWNRAVEELTGVKAESIIGKGNFEYAVPFYGCRLPILVDVAITPNLEQERHYKSFRRDGDTVEAEIFVPHFRPGGVYLWAKARRLLDAAGNVIGAIETVRDITEHKRMQERMVQTEKMVMVGGLAAGMAHEINNPLGAIMQHAQNIERRVSADIPANLKAAAEVGVDLALVRTYLQKRGIFDFIGHIRSAGMRASEIISNMLHFSRRGDFGAEYVDLSVLLDRVLELAGSDYDMKKKYAFSGIELQRMYANGLPPVLVTVADMEQVLLNILKNAAQAMVGAAPGRQQRITLRTSTAGGMVLIEIEDNGPGMDEAVRLRIFEPFYSSKAVGAGTGLGLSVAYAIVTKGHHGSIEVTSQQGAGCCVAIRLPLQGRDS